MASEVRRTQRFAPRLTGAELDIPPPSYRRPARRGLDPASRRLVLIAGGIGAALLVVFLVGSLGGRQRQGVPVIEANSGPIRVKPQDPGGMKIADEEESIVSGAAESGGATQSAPARLAPPPEVPAPQALRAETAPQPATPPATTAAPAQAPSAPMASASTASAPPSSAHAPAAAGAGGAAGTAPRAKAASESSREHEAGREHAHRFGVQLAALRSEDEARQEWERLAHKMPDLLAGKRPAIARTEREGQTYWRLRTGAFADAAEATAFCQRVRAKGAGCTPAAF